MAQRSVPAPFLTKTYQLVEDPSTNDVISWNDAGTSFVVWKTADFARDLLPKYFKHNNFSSFVRQLNTYVSFFFSFLSFFLFSFFFFLFGPFLLFIYFVFRISTEEHLAPTIETVFLRKKTIETV